MNLFLRKPRIYYIVENPIHNRYDRYFLTFLFFLENHLKSRKDESKK
ncbi:MAG: hypothetical protein HeimC3_38500 [Candidatus Heimdallarchaeota archaeon LC_3]|nr:MAG: hypothetical protein HeimC3_38500 [Candidatus Heimdallarchaeota archaeon LC_3]